MKQFASAQCVISISKVSPIVVTPLGNSQYPLKVSKFQKGVFETYFKSPQKTNKIIFNIPAQASKMWSNQKNKAISL